MTTKKEIIIKKFLQYEHEIKKLIDASFACSWDCVKFQKRNPDVCVPENQKNIMLFWESKLIHKLRGKSKYIF